MASKEASLPTVQPGHTHAAERRAKIVCSVGPVSSCILQDLQVLWGVRPVAGERVRTAEEMVRGAERELMQQGPAAPGDVVAVISGTRGASGSTNLMRLHIVGEGQPPPERRRARTPIKRNPEDPKR
jgi:pyruvate kinase-like protein